MEFTNSPLVVYTAFSPNHSGLRTHAIDRITPHCVVGTPEDWRGRSSQGWGYGWRSINNHR